ncbi:MAG: ABC transporter ATP-binding protein [Alphaproteobacteria bacterium]
MTVRARRVAFGQTVLFEDLELALPGGSWTCLLGPSGVGKTTLLRMLAGLIPHGRDLSVACSDGAPLEGRMAWMGQQDLLLPWLDVAENVLLGSRLRGERPPRERAAELLRAVGLGGNAADRPSALSGGMRQRAALVRTLVEDRPVVLMDEPFSAVDVVTRHELQTLAGRLLAGRTVLLVTHDPLEALRLGDRILVLAGRPVRLHEAPVPPGTRPRDVTDPRLLAEQAELLGLLAAAREAA